MFETRLPGDPGAGAIPAELSYQQNGLMFGKTGSCARPALWCSRIRPSRGTRELHPQLHDLRPGRQHARSGATFSPPMTSGRWWPRRDPARFSTLTGAGGAGRGHLLNVYLGLNGRLPYSCSASGQLLQPNPALPGGGRRYHRGPDPAGLPEERHRQCLGHRRRTSSARTRHSNALGTRARSLGQKVQRSSCP